MRITQVKDRAVIEAFLRQEPELQIYSLGDLDDFYWPNTTWYGWQKAGALREVVLVYAGRGLPTVVAISENPAGVRKLLREVVPLLPHAFYAHLSPGVEAALKKTHRFQSHGLHHKMALRDSSRVQGIDCSAAVQLTPEDRDSLIRLYDESYPENWFDPGMLATRQYFGLRVDGWLVSVAGVHVYSERYRVAAVGNVVTHPDHRTKGYGTLVTARLCQSLLETADHIGLNVKADNTPAMACYRRLGFEIVAPFSEFTIEKV
jgi:ribosomal protein S18 acetylase RimI-like enzyme